MPGVDLNPDIEIAGIERLHGRRFLFVANEVFFFLSHRKEIAQAAVLAGSEVHLAAPADHVWAPPHFDHRAALREIGVHFHELPISRRGRNPLQELRAVVALAKIVRRVRPDITHLLTIKPIIYGCLLARVVDMGGVVAAFTGLGHIFSGREIGLGLVRLCVTTLLRFGLARKRLVAMFQNVVDRDLIIKVTGISREATFVLPGAGVDLARFQPRPIPVGSPVVVLPARMIWDKGIGEFVAAARLVKERGHDLRFVLVGGTHESNPRAVPIHQLQAWVEEGLVEWWGRRDDMEAVYEMATVVCLPTTYGEGVPKVLLEAMAAGRPVVASDVAGCREVVEGGVTGVLVPPGDVSALATTILRVATEREFARLLAVNARRAAVDRFGVGTVVGATLRIYLDLFAADQ